MLYVIVFVLGVLVGILTTMASLKYASPESDLPFTRPARRRLPDGVKRGRRPDLRRVVLRPTNINEPPSRVTQALFRQQPTRKLEDDE